MSNVAVPRQALTVLAVAPIRWANLLNLAEEFLYVFWQGIILAEFRSRKNCFYGALSIGE